MIGLIDCDMLQRGMSFFPNLDLMKLYSYYKAFDSCKLIRPRDDISYYSKLYIWKDLKESYINDKFWEHNNIITGGLYFNNNCSVNSSALSVAFFIEFILAECSDVLASKIIP